MKLFMLNKSARDTVNQPMKSINQVFKCRIQNLGKLTKAIN